MARKCCYCGKTVIVGQGKWVTVAEGLPVILAHISPALCQKASEQPKRSGEALAQARKRKSEGVLEASDGSK